MRVSEDAASVTILRGDARLQGYDMGTGPPVLFEHGLGGSRDQVEEVFPAGTGWRRLTLDCRGHGRSEGGTERPFSIAMFAADALAFADARGVERFVAGGVSMGAAIAMRLAVRHPGRVRALIMARPAWLFEAAPPYMRTVCAVADALRALPPDRAKAAFARSAPAIALARDAPCNLAALLRFFDRPDPGVMADLCTDIAMGEPGSTRDEIAALRLPTLVIGSAGDMAHPLATAHTLARTIPGAVVVEVPGRALGKAGHLRAMRTAIGQFLDSLPTEGAG